MVCVGVHSSVDSLSEKASVASSSSRSSEVSGLLMSQVLKVMCWLCRRMTH